MLIVLVKYNVHFPLLKITLLTQLAAKIDIGNASCKQHGRNVKYGLTSFISSHVVSGR